MKVLGPYGSTRPGSRGASPDSATRRQLDLKGAAYVDIEKAVSPTFTSRSFFSNQAQVLIDSDGSKGSSIKKGGKNSGEGGNLHVKFDLNSDMGSEDGSAGSDGVPRL